MWNIVNYDNKYLDDMLLMTEEYYGKEENISNKKFIEHEYFKNPDGKAIIKLANDVENHVLAGQYIVIPRKIKVKNKEYKSVLSLNTLTRKQYRGQKVFISLAEEVYSTCSKNDVIFCYGAPNQNSHHGFVKKMGFCDIGIMPLYLKIVKPSLLVKEKTRLSALSIPIKIFDFMGYMKKRKIAGVEFVEINKNNYMLFEQLWDKLKNKYQVMGVRNSEYINWRYLNMPLRDYKIIVAILNNEPCGYIIGRVTKVAEMNCGMIVDFLFTKGQFDIGSSLLSYLKYYFDSQNVGLLGCLMKSNVEEVLCLKKAGFFVCPKFLEPQPFPIIFRQFNSISEDITLNNFDNWFFTMGDYDVI